MEPGSGVFCDRIRPYSGPGGPRRFPARDHTVRNLAKIGRLAQRLPLKPRPPPAIVAGCIQMSFYARPVPKPGGNLGRNPEPRRTTARARRNQATKNPRPARQPQQSPRGPTIFRARPHVQPRYFSLANFACVFHEKNWRILSLLCQKTCPDPQLVLFRFPQSLRLGKK